MTLTKKNPRIGKAVVILKKLSEDERTRMLAEDREKAWKDQQGRLDFALQQGFEQGREKGREEGLRKGVTETKIEMAKKALSEGLSVELIQRLTGLKPEEIGALKNE
jgi:predicted transposase/invertase (TIGR01784 family)